MCSSVKGQPAPPANRQGAPHAAKSCWTRKECFRWASQRQSLFLEGGLRCVHSCTAPACLRVAVPCRSSQLVLPTEHCAHRQSIRLLLSCDSWQPRPPHICFWGRAHNCDPQVCEQATKSSTAVSGHLWDTYWLKLLLSLLVSDHGVPSAMHPFSAARQHWRGLLH